MRLRRVAVASLAGALALSGLQTIDASASAARPSISRLSAAASAAAGGATVTVHGHNLHQHDKVYFGKTRSRHVVVKSATRLLVRVPAHAPGPVSVTVHDGERVSARTAHARFRYQPRPTVNSLSVNHGKTGGSTRVLISGSGFDSSATVRFGTAAGSAVHVGSTRSLAVTAPRSTPSTVDVTVTTRWGRSAVVRAARFTYTAPPCTRTVGHLSGTLKTQTLTTQCVSSYVLDGPVSIPAGQTVTLGAGVVLAAQPTASIDVAGVLIANGTSAAPVTITANSSTPKAGAWPGITVERGGAANLTATLRYAATALRVRDGATVAVRGRILGSTVGIDSPDAVVDARHVDWGSTNGPAPIGSGTRISGSGVFATPWTGFARPPRPITTLDPTRPKDRECRAVAFIGARGSGEGPQGASAIDAAADRDLLGAGVTPILDALAQAKPGTSVRTIGLRYPAAPVPYEQFSAFRADYLASIYAGVDQLKATVERERAECPGEKIVLAGYSQGALVAHLALAELSPQTLASITAVELVADPARTSTDKDIRYGDNLKDQGTAATNAAGIWTVIFGATPLPSAIAGRTAETCHAQEAVCAAAAPDGTRADLDGDRLDPQARGAPHVSYGGTGELAQLGQHAARLS